MFQQDITNSVEPAMADPSSLARAAASNAQAIETLAGAAGTFYKGYVEGELRNIQEEGAALQQEFFVSNQAASVAGRRAAGLAGQRPEAGGMFAETLMGAQGSEAQQKAASLLKQYDNELERLKNASMGGMSNEQYVSRIDALTKESIAKYPGLADQIRQRVGEVTGLTGADRWAQMNYVRERFTQSQQAQDKTGMNMVTADIKRVAEMGQFGTQEQLFNLYQTDRAAYDQRMNAANQVLAQKTQTDLIKNNVSALSGQSDLEADKNRAGFVAVFAGSLGGSVLTQSVQDQENTFKNTFELMAKGDPNVVDPVKFNVLVQTHAARMRTAIEDSRRAAYSTVDAYLANNPTISDSKRKELYADIDRAAEVATKQYADDKGVGLVAMSNIMLNYRDRTLKEQSDLVDLAIKQQSAMQNNPLVSQYWQGGAARENLKRTQPAFYTFMEQQESNLTSSLMGVRDTVKGASDLASVQRVMLQGQNNPGPVSRDDTVDTTTQKAALEALTATSTDYLKKQNLTPVEVSVVSAGMSSAVTHGNSSIVLADYYKEGGAAIAKLPNDAQAIIKGNISNSVANTLRNVMDVKRVIEDKYGVILSIGSNDAGQIMVVPKAGMVAGSQDTYNYTTAATEFMKKTKPLLSNVIHARAMAMQEEPSAIGKEYAGVINKNDVTYRGFFNLEPAAPEAPPANMEDRVKKIIANMKLIDPNLNEEYVYNAYVNADPEKKKQFEQMLTQ